MDHIENTVSNNNSVMTQWFGVNYWSPKLRLNNLTPRPLASGGSSRRGSFGRERVSGYFSHGNVFLRGIGHWRELDMR
jgi:hypothetical protein